MAIAQTKIRRIGRQVVAALPVIFGPTGAQVILVTSMTTQRFIAPKGAIEISESPRRAARREALEEAGVMGKISRKPIGLLVDAPGEPATIPLYLLKVAKVLDEWPEKSMRTRAIVSPEKAATMTDDQFLISVLLDLSSAGPDPWLGDIEPARLLRLRFQ